MMKRITIAIVLVVCMPLLARAELRSIALDVHQAKDKSVQVSMYSDVKEEKQKDISVAKATEILKKSKGWGSAIEVAIITDGNVDLSVYLPLLQAIANNTWLDLAILKPRRGMGDRILKHYNIEQSTRGDSLKAAPQE
jgi:hypothetical protein